jgi:hypothetical protein
MLRSTYLLQQSERLELTDTDLSSVMEVTATKSCKPDTVSYTHIKYAKFLKNIMIKGETSD